MNNLWDTITGFSGQLEEWILQLTDSLWIYPWMYILSVVDGFFPVVPSESVIIASATAWAQTGSPWLPGIWIAAATGAWCGDQIAYGIGRLFDVTKWKMFNTEKGKASLAWADSALEKRGSTFIIAARFIPMGRVIANISAGALRYPHRRFMGVDAIGALIWATYSVVLGIFTGSLFSDNLILSIVVGVVAGIVMGFVIDRVMQKIGFSPPEVPDLSKQIETPAADGGKNGNIDDGRDNS
ncbi:DedA family protein [Demequina oxidasica]|uniref:DedA family protein n=1 Tax=Demequina oxidasica TaxID=676199 RepID=UPI000AC53CB8|nr:DedA family protein [Demequina oxidasica]